MSNQGTACKKFWGVPVQNATNPPPLCMHRTPSVWEFQGIPKKGRSRAGKSNGYFSDSLPREFPLWEFQVTTLNSANCIFNYTMLEK